MFKKMLIVVAALVMSLGVASAATYIPATTIIDGAVTDFTADTGTLVTKFTPLLLVVTGSMAGFGLFRRFFKTSLR